MSAYLRLNGNSPSIKHFFDIIYNVEPNLVNVDNLKAIIRDKAWEELPDVMKLAQRPTFQYVSQYFLLPQTNDKICVVKHIYVKEDKVKGQYVRLLIKGTGHELSWGTQNKHKARRGLQYMLEQLGGNQFRHFTLSAEKRKAIAGPAPGHLVKKIKMPGGTSSLSMVNGTRGISSSCGGSTATSTAKAVPSMDGAKSSCKEPLALWPMMVLWLP